MLATATAIGTTAATSPRNTRTSTISASASPNSSPRARSSSAARLKSSSIESSPTTSASNPCPPFAASTARDDGLHVATELDEQQRAVAVARDGAVTDLRRARRAEVARERPQPRAEARVVRGHPRRRHDHRLVDLEVPVRAHGRERPLEHLLGPLRLRAAGEVVVGGQGVAEQAGDGDRRQEHHHDPGAEHRPAVAGADPGQPLRDVPECHRILRSRGSHRSPTRSRERALATRRAAGLSAYRLAGISEDTAGTTPVKVRATRW